MERETFYDDEPPGQWTAYHWDPETGEGVFGSDDGTLETRVPQPAGPWHARWSWSRAVAQMRVRYHGIVPRPDGGRHHT